MWGTMAISATNIFLSKRKRHTVLGISEWTNLALSTFSLSPSVCSIRSCYDFTYNSLYVFVQWNKAAGQCCIVLCAWVCEYVSFTGSVVLLFGLIVIRWDKDAAKYGKSQTGQWGRNVYLYFLLLWSNSIEWRLAFSLLYEAVFKGELWKDGWRGEPGRWDGKKTSDQTDSWSMTHSRNVG